MAHPDGMLTDDLVTIYERLAASGAGAVITEYMDDKGNGSTFANMRMFDRDAHGDIYKGINDRLKRFGAGHRSACTRRQQVQWKADGRGCDRPGTSPEERLGQRL
jgi:hypothetical protein